VATPSRSIVEHASAPLLGRMAVEAAMRISNNSGGAYPPGGSREPMAAGPERAALSEPEIGEAMTEGAQINPYFVSQRISLSRNDVIDALRAAVLSRAGELARFGEPNVRQLALDAKVSQNAGVDILGVVATVEAQLDAALVAALSPPALSVPALSGPAWPASDHGAEPAGQVTSSPVRGEQAGLRLADERVETAA